MLKLLGVLLSLAAASNAQNEPSFTFGLGSLFGLTGDNLACVGTSERKMYEGVAFTVDLLRNSKPLYIKDSTGKQYRILFDYKNYPGQTCNRTEHISTFRQLVDDSSVHFVIGAPTFAITDSPDANKRKKIISQCCTSTDAVFDLDLPYVFGTLVSSRRYAEPVLKAMAFAGVERLAMGVRANILAGKSICDAAREYVATMQTLRPNFQLVHVDEYNVSTPANPTEDVMSQRLVAAAIAAKADAYLLCDYGLPMGANLTKAFDAQKHYLKALWVMNTAATDDFVAAAGRSSENVLSTTQWHQSMTYADPFFGKAQDYYNNIHNATGGSTADYLTAASSVSAFMIARAIQEAFSYCNLTSMNGDVQQLLYNSTKLVCKNLPLWLGNSTGNELIRNALSSISVNTFFGTIELNRFRRNVGFTPAVTQIQERIVQCVMPLGAATTPLIMPIPPPTPPPTPWIEDPQYIAILTIAVCFVLVLLLAAVGWATRQHLPGLMSVTQAVSISYDAIKVDVQPTWSTNKLGYEPGEGTYRGSRVSLVPAMDLLSELAPGQRDNSARGAVRTPSMLTNFAANLRGKSARHANADTPTISASEPVSTPTSAAAPKPTWNGTPAAIKAAAGSIWRIMRLQHSSLNPLFGVVWNWPSLEAPVLVRGWSHFGSLTQLMENDTIDISLHLKSKMVVNLAAAIEYLHAQEPPMFIGPLNTDSIFVDASFNAQLAPPLTCAASAQFAHHFKAPTPPRDNPEGNISAEVLGFGAVVCRVFAQKEKEMPYKRSSLGHCLSQAKLAPIPADNELECALPGCDREVDQVLLDLGKSMPQLATVIKGCMGLYDVSAGQEPLEKQDSKILGKQISVVMDGLDAAIQVVGKAPAFQNFGQIGDALSRALERYIEASSNAASRKGKGLAGLWAGRRRKSRGSSRSEAGASESVNDYGEDENGAPSRKGNDDVLFDIFPPKVATALLQGREIQPERYEMVSIFFSDIVGYTDICGQLQAHEVMDLLHRLYSRFDGLIRQSALFKVETIGDAYMAVANLRWPQADTHARLLCQFAMNAIEIANGVQVHPDMPELGHVNIRVGLHSGPVVASVVGTLNRRYCLFGDTVNTSSRMESNSERNRVHCSKAFADILIKQWPQVQLQSRGLIDIKGKGMMETFWVSKPTMPA